MKYECAPWVSLPGWVCDEDRCTPLLNRETLTTDLDSMAVEDTQLPVDNALEKFSTSSWGRFGFGHDGWIELYWILRGASLLCGSEGRNNQANDLAWLAQIAEIRSWTADRDQAHDLSVLAECADLAEMKEYARWEMQGGPD